MSNTQQHNTHDDTVQYDMSMYFTVHVTFQGWKYCDIVILLYACLLFYSHKKKHDFIIAKNLPRAAVAV